MEQISEYTQFVESLQKELAVPMSFRKEFLIGNKFGLDENKIEQIHQLKKKQYNLLNNSKIFILEKDIAQMLYLTDNDVFPRQIPFDNFFIETSFNLECGTNIRGIHIYKDTESGIIMGNANFYNKDLPMSLPITFELFTRDRKEKKSKERYVVILKQKKLQTFICNFLDFLNDPEVELRTYERSEKNRERRIKNGKIPIPPINFIIVTGKLKIYQDSLSEGIHFSYSHKFLVRGHFRRLQDEERYGELEGKRIWIKPYIKGKGILKDKNYKLKKEVRNFSQA